MIDEELVRLAHVASVDCIHRQHLRAKNQQQGGMATLERLLFGVPLTENRADKTAEAALGADLTACLRGVLELLAREVGPSSPLAQARLEWGRVLELPYDFEGIAARRAALLFALHTLPAVRWHFEQGEPVLVRELERLLPVLIPAFVAGMAQKPEALVILTSTLASMWQGEQMGSVGGVGVNKPAHVDESV